MTLIKPQKASQRNRHAQTDSARGMEKSTVSLAFAPRQQGVHDANIATTAHGPQAKYCRN